MLVSSSHCFFGLASLAVKCKKSKKTEREKGNDRISIIDNNDVMPIDIRHTCTERPASQTTSFSGWHCVHWRNRRQFGGANLDRSSKWWVRVELQGAWHAQNKVHATKYTLVAFVCFWPSPWLAVSCVFVVGFVVNESHHFKRQHSSSGCFRSSHVQHDHLQSKQTRLMAPCAEGKEGILMTSSRSID